MSPSPIVCTAPGRANLIGNPSDQYGGCTLACSVPLRARVEIAPAEGWTLRCGSHQARLGGRQDLVRRGDRFDLARAVLEELGLEAPPARVEFGSEIPLGSGIAGSSALLVALLRGLLEWRGPGSAPPRHALAEWAREIERGRLGVTCGYVDPYLAVFGGLRFVDFSGKSPEGGGEHEPLATLEDLAPEVPVLPFVLGFTGVRHSSDSVHRPIRERWLAGEPPVREAYRRVAELGRLGKRALLAGDWKALGRWMNENHAIQRELGGSGASNERLIEAALDAGAPGAKLAGAGQGGTVVALWPEADAAPLEAAWRAAGVAAIQRPVPVAGVEILEA